MITILFSIIVILIGVIGFQYKNTRKRNKDIDYIANKINLILDNKSNEKVAVITADDALKELLIAVNALLEFSQKAEVNYIKKEIAMRKMLSNISHDLKTPLTVILGCIEEINLDKEMSHLEREKILSKVHGKTLEMITLINKFFDLAKLESGDKPIPVTRINVSESCRKSILSYYEILNREKLEVIIDIPETEIYAFANEEALTRILGNLITNAVRYGKDGKVVGLSLRCDDSFAYIEVWDQGKGIEDTKQEKVFERMYTLEDSRNKDYEGSGLGLTITKRLTELLGGEISLVSIPYKKTIFTVKLKRITY